VSSNGEALGGDVGPVSLQTSSPPVTPISCASLAAEKLVLCRLHFELLQNGEDLVVHEKTARRLVHVFLAVVVLNLFVHRHGMIVLFLARMDDRCLPNLGYNMVEKETFEIIRNKVHRNHSEP
jgi:hypothetical protein